MIFQDNLLQAQEWPILTSRKSGRGSRRPAGMHKELLAKLRRKKEVYKGWEK